MQGYKAIGYDDGGIMTRLPSWPTQEKPFMTKKEIASKIAKQFEITQLLALEAVQMVFDGIIETLMDEGRIELRNFGVFEVRRRRARKARNPRTGESVSVPARLVVTFKQGMEMEQRVNELKGSRRQK
jgi:integration host factor subunit beta